MTRPTDLLATDTSARLHARAVAVMERLRGFEGRAARELARGGCRAFPRYCRVEVFPGARLVCCCSDPPSDLIDLLRMQGLSFDAACAHLESIADALDREAARAAGQGELF